jgi:hypothetical protein
MTGIKRKTNNNQINKIIASTATLHSLEPLANMLPNSLELNCQTYWIDGVGIWLDLLMIRTYVRKFWYQSPGLWIIQVTKDSHYNMQRQPELNKDTTKQLQIRNFQSSVRFPITISLLNKESLIVNFLIWAEQHQNNPVDRSCDTWCG